MIHKCFYLFLHYSNLSMIYRKRGCTITQSAFAGNGQKKKFLSKPNKSNLSVVKLIKNALLNLHFIRRDGG